MRCPSLETLTGYLRGLTVGIERTMLQEHLNSDCPHCQSNQRWLTDVQRVAMLDDSFEFPATVTTHIISWMPKKPAPTPLCTALAQLLFDSFVPQPLTEMRAAVTPDAKADASEARQLLYQVDNFDVDFRLEKTERASTCEYELIGQVLLKLDNASVSMEGHSVRLWWDEKNPLHAITDTEGIFRFTGLPSATYQLEITLPEIIIQIPSLIIGEN